MDRQELISTPIFYLLTICMARDGGAYYYHITVSAYHVGAHGAHVRDYRTHVLLLGMLA